MSVYWLRSLFVVALILLAGCGGGGSSSVQVGGVTYTVHDFSLSPSVIKGATASTH